MPYAANNSYSISFGFNLPFAEQAEFLRQKLNLGTKAWDDITHSAHDRSFVVAGAMKADLLADLHAAVQKEVDGGTTLETFRKDFREIVTKHGWHGWTGEGTAAGEAWRTRVIYETNLYTSYAAGRYAQLTDPDLLKVCPYWKYVHDDGVTHPRPEHVALHSLVLRHDHPFWQTHYPPNGWGCRCRVTAVTAPGEGDKTEPPKGWDSIDPKTGTPPGIDKGWAYAPGASVADDLRKIVEAKAGKYQEPLKGDFLASAQQVMGQGGVKLQDIDDYVALGRSIVDKLPASSIDAGVNPLYTGLLKELQSQGINGNSVTNINKGAGTSIVKQASKLYPKEWVKASDNYGALEAKITKKRAAYYPQLDQIVVTKYNLPTSVHEFAHRLQHVMPELQAKFAELHRRRTAGEELLSLRKLTGNNFFDSDEFTRKDKYVSPYYGKEYKGEPLEVMTMAFEAVLGGRELNFEGKPLANSLHNLYNKDREMLNLVVGLLFGWRP